MALAQEGDCRWQRRTWGRCYGRLVQRLSAQDASFLHLEDAVTHMHIGAVAIIEGPPPDYDDMAARVTAKLPVIPRYRQKVRFVPLALGRPVWTDDSHFNLHYHLRRTGLPSPGGDRELQRLVGRVMSQQLDRHKPLWELWMIEGLSQNRWGLITKVHHSMVDGVSGAELLGAILDDEREPELHRSPEWKPERERSGAELAVGGVVHRAVSPLGGLRSLAGSPWRIVESAIGTASGLRAFSGAVRPPPKSSLNGPVGPHRRWEWARSQLSEVKRVRAAFGGTVNDVILSAVAGGFRDLLASRREPADRDVRSLVPVSVRSKDEAGTYNNRVSAMFADLPVGIEDPVERLRALEARMEHLKHSNESVAGEVLVGLSGFAPAMLLSVALRTATHLPQRSVNTVTTNVPGPQRPLYAAGRRMLECFPYVPLGGHVRVGVAIFSYDGGLHFGVTGDYDTAPDIGVLCRGIERSMSELGEAAAASSTRSRRSRPRPRVRT